jgi:hypothetical protein
MARLHRAIPIPLLTPAVLARFPVFSELVFREAVFQRRVKKLFIHWLYAVYLLFAMNLIDHLVLGGMAVSVFHHPYTLLKLADQMNLRAVGFIGLNRLFHR